SNLEHITLDKKIMQFKELLKIQAQSDLFSDIKDYYLQKIDLILCAFDNDDLEIKEFLKTENALEEFLQHAEEHKISYSYKKYNLLIEITKESELCAIDLFFKNFLDENMRKNLKKQDSIT